MNNLITETTSNALSLAGDAASRMRNGVVRWVPAAMKTVAAGANLVVLRDGSRKIARVVRRNPVATAATMTVAVGAGVALWLLRRNRQQRGLDEKMRPLEIEAVRVERKTAPKPARKRAAPRKTATKRAARVNGGE